MNSKRHPTSFVALHWLTFILLSISALLSKQKDMQGLPLNQHMILGGILVIVMIVRLISKIRTLHHGNRHRNEFVFYLLLYLFVFFMLGMGGWIAYQRNLLGYLLDPNTAIGRGSFKRLADIHKIGWQITLGWIILHVSMVTYRQLIRREPVFRRMWFGGGHTN